MSSEEQKLIDLAFELVLTITAKPHVGIFKNKSNEDKAEWVADQLRKCGFDTYPCGMSWGVLRSRQMSSDELSAWYVGCASVSPRFPGDPMDWVTREFDDRIRDIGDRIVSLSPSEANDLNRYLKTKGVDK